jgi:PIN domain nuclease of toxin-antitoxin system
VTLLLDTHAVLWFWWADPRLSSTAMALICDPANRKMVSPATAWEVAIKVSLAKLDIGGPYRSFESCTRTVHVAFGPPPITLQAKTLRSSER